MIVPKNNNHKTDSNNPQNPSSNNISVRRIPSQLCYEPTSVLDLRRSPSPSPVAAAGHNNHKLANGKGNSVINPDAELGVHPPNDSLEWDEQVFQNLDWDSITDLAGLHDDSAPPFKQGITPSATNNNGGSEPGQLTFSDLMISHPQPFDQHHHHQNHNFNISDPSTGGATANNAYNLNLNYDVSFNDFQSHHSSNNNSVIGFDFIEDLIRVADCVDSDDSHLAEAILDRLNNRLRSTSHQPAGNNSKLVGKPLQRAALMFKEALQSLLTGSNRPARLSSWSDIVQTIKAYKAFSVISPIPMFSHFTTNQALLEALSGSAFVHVVDFDIGLGGQYASLMRELAEKFETPSVVLRVTAVVPEELAVEARLVKENLAHFALELKIRFQIDFVFSRTFEVLSFKSVKLVEGERLAVLLSAAALRRGGSSASGFLSELRRASPSVVVFVDGEGSPDIGGGSHQSSTFRRSFVAGLEFFSVVMESVEAAMVGGEWARRIEAFVLKPRVTAAVEAAASAGRKTASFREAFHVAGFRPVQLSQFADFQAECLLGKVQVRGFHVAKHQAELVLCWHDRAMVATSVWRC